jgi:NAD-dependent SIR2 family protein deacetylase
VTTRLKCTRCLRRKPREEFRETPWHGRAAACQECERFRRIDHLYERQRWELEQQREKVRMLIRHVQRLRLQRMLRPAVTSGEAFEAYHQPYYDAVERAQLRWLAAFTTLAVPEYERATQRERSAHERKI